MDQHSGCTPSFLSVWMGDCLRADKLSQYVNNHPGQLSLAIPQWAGAKNTSQNWCVYCVDRHTE